MHQRGAVHALLAVAVTLGCGDAVEGTSTDAETGSDTSNMFPGGGDPGDGGGDDGGDTGDDGGTATGGGGTSTGDGTTSDGGTSGGDDTTSGTGTTGGGTTTGSGATTSADTGSAGTSTTTDAGTSTTLDTTSTAGTSTGSQTTTSTDTTTTTTITTTSTTDAACTQTETFTMLAEDADVSGDWTKEQSTVGEGVYAYPGGSDGSLLFTADVPCDDDWYVWIRFFDNNNDDSWLCTVDGQPQPAAIVEGDCTAMGPPGWEWAQMNWRDPGDPGCTYVEDPWIHTWSAGLHEIEFTYRETSSIARLIITNDAGFVPP